MKIYILTEGGRGHGFGHIARMLAFFQAFRLRGLTPVFVVNGDDTVGSVLGGCDCHFVDWINDDHFFASVCADGDVIVIDSYLACLVHYERVSRFAIGVYLDDDMRLRYPRGFVINAAIGAESFPYPAEKNTDYLLGSQYAFIRSQFCDIDPERFCEEVSQILIIFGGVVNFPLTEIAINAARSRYRRANLKVVLPLAAEKVPDFALPVDSAVELVCSPTVHELASLMAASDIAISAGGQSLNELAVTRTPAVVVCTAKNQRRVISGWEKAGVIQYAGSFCRQDLSERIQDKLEHYKDPENRRASIAAAKQVIDGFGSERLVKAVCRKYYERRIRLSPARIGDAKALFDLANDEFVRRNSFSSSPIRWQEHIGWFDGKLADENSVLYCVRDGDVFLGQVRFDIDPATGVAVISIGLARELRGLGLAAFVISSAVKKVSCIARVSVIVAYVKDSNKASVSAFKRSGFSFFESVIFDGVDSGKYTLKGIFSR